MHGVEAIELSQRGWKDNVVFTVPINYKYIRFL